MVKRKIYLSRIGVAGLMACLGGFQENTPAFHGRYMGIWTEADDAYLAANWARRPTAEIAERLDRSIDSVIVRVTRFRRRDGVQKWPLNYGWRDTQS